MFNWILISSSSCCGTHSCVSSYGGLPAAPNPNASNPLHRSGTDFEVEVAGAAPDFNQQTTRPTVNGGHYSCVCAFCTESLTSDAVDHRLTLHLTQVSRDLARNWWRYLISSVYEVPLTFCATIFVIDRYRCSGTLMTSDTWLIFMLSRRKGFPSP